jgi:hypothetical protein
MADIDDEPSQHRPPGWLNHGTLGAMTIEANRALHWGRGAEGAALAARDVVWARYPSLPLTMIADAVAAVVPDPAGLSAARGEAPMRHGEPLRAVTPDEIAQSLAYALRFDDRGKPRRTGYEATAALAAAQLAPHLARSGGVVMRGHGANSPVREDDAFKTALSSSVRGIFTVGRQTSVRVLATGPTKRAAKPRFSGAFSYSGHSPHPAPGWAETGL